MTLTPSDIEQKTFSTALRGYNLDEVDDFLDEIVRSMRKLHEELEEARAARIEMPPAEPEPLEEVEIPPAAIPVVEPTPLPTIDESAVGKALIAAQETAERIVTDARSEADQILVRARSDADTFEETRLKRKAEAEQEITRIDVLVGRVKSELAELSTAVGADLDEMTRTIDAAITELDEAAAEIDREAADDEASAGDDDVAPVEALDDENLVASDEPDLPAGLAGIAADPLGEPGDEDSSEDDDEAESDEGSGEDSESGSDDEYFNFPDGDDDGDEDEDDEEDDDEEDDDEERTD